MVGTGYLRRSLIKPGCPKPVEIFPYISCILLAFSLTTSRMNESFKSSQDKRLRSTRKSIFSTSKTSTATAQLGHLPGGRHVPCHALPCPRYYGVIIVRTLLFLAGLIWMQHLMVRRVLAVETTSRRHLAGRPPRLGRDRCIDGMGSLEPVRDTYDIL